jgi:hypothetical protein
LIGLGALFLLDEAGVVDAGRTLGAWWPLGFVVAGAVLLVVDRRATSGAVFLGVTGAILLSFTTGVLDGRAWSFIWPIVIIAAGAGTIVAGGRVGSRGPDLRSMVVLHRRTLRPPPGFRSATVTAVLGAVRLDLTGGEAAPGGVEVAATAILSGIDVIVPDGWHVSISGVPILGAWDDTTRRDSPPGAPQLRVRAFPILGGVEVRHERRWQ